MNIAENVSKFIGGDKRKPAASEASFDFCFNYFQSFHRSKNIKAIAASENMELSCLQLGFYLASWGMFRKGPLKRGSSKQFQPLIEELAGFDNTIWEIDVPDYRDAKKASLLLTFGDKVASCLQNNSDILKTKVMLGVFGNVPAFDTFFSEGILGVKNKLLALSSDSLKKIVDFYDANIVEIDKYKIPTLDFQTGEPTSILYPRAKIIDMIYYVEGGGLLSYESASSKTEEED